MMSRGTLMAGLFLTLSVPVTAVAQPQDAPAACPSVGKKPLAGLIDWVAAEGAPETLPASIFGLPGDGKVAVLQRAYRNPATHLVHAVFVNVAEGRCDVIFVVDDIGNATTWVTDAGATLGRTFHLAQGKNESVPNERYVSEYETIKSYFLERMPDRYAR
jgi:hypothetical protein